MENKSDRTIDDLIFVGFKNRVVAIGRTDGAIVWDWKAPSGSTYATVMLDGDRLIVGVDAYFYCLDPIFGQEVWRQPLKGYGTGVASITSTRGAQTTQSAAAAIAAQQAASSSSAATM